MSRKLLALALPSLMFSLALGTPAASQGGANPRLREIGERIQILQPQVETALVDALAADSARMDSVRVARQVPQDTVSMGPFQVVTVEGQAPLAKDIFNPLALEILPLIRGSEGRFRGTTFLFHYAWRTRELFVDADRVFKVQLSRRNSRDRLKEQARAAMGEALHGALPPDADSLNLWAGPRLLALDEEWPWIYRELASTPSLAVRRCYEGDLRWCWEALGLTANEGGDRDWYSPPERRQLVENRYGFYRRFSSDDLDPQTMLIRGCLDLMEDRACQLVLEGYPLREGKPRRNYEIPLSHRARSSLASEALRMGGEGAYTRLNAHPELPIRTRLAEAANMPVDQLIGEWRTKVMASRPNVQAGLLWSPITLLVWLVVLALFAMRSSRWRLG